jgi:hypothetical protein
MSWRPLSILFRRSNVLTTGISLIPDVIKPKAMLSEFAVLSKEKSLICSPLCLNSSMPVPRRSLVISWVADWEGRRLTFLSSLGFSASLRASLLPVGGYVRCSNDSYSSC